MKKLLAISLVAACGGGGDDDTTTATPTPPPRITITAPAQAMPGDPLHVAWTVAELPDGAGVALRLREPGAPIAATLAGYFDPGSAPATGPVWWIDDGGVAVAELTTAANASGQLDVTLPSAAEGDWEVDAIVLDAGGAPMTFAAATTWIATGPAVRLDLSRTWAAPDDLVHAAITVRDGEVEPLRLSAWLTVPDGTVYSLPYFQTEYAPIAEGTLASGTTELVRDRIGEHGDGTYLLSVTLETLDGVRRGGAGAVIHVCSEAGTIDGTIDGAAAGRLLLLDPVDGGVDEAVVDASGAFHTDIAAGRYLVLGSGDGWVTGGDVEVACGGTTTLALTAKDGPAAKAAHVVRPRADLPVRAPKVRFVSGIAEAISQADMDSAIAALRHDFEQLAVPVGGAPIHTWSDAEAAAAMQQELLDQTRNDDSTGGREAALGEFSVQLQVRVESDTYLVDVYVFDGSTGDAIAEVHDSMGAALISELDDRMETLARALIGEQQVIAKMRDRLELPENPVMKLSLDRREARPGDTVTIAASLSDAKPAGPVPNRHVEIVVRVPGGPALQTSTLTTDAAGIASTTFTVPDSPAQIYEVTAKIVRRNGTEVGSAAAAFQTRPPGYDGLVSAPTGLLQTGERTTASFHTGSYLPAVAFTATNGQPDSSSGTADASGHGVMGFTAGLSRGPATLISEFFARPGFVGPLVVDIPVRFFVLSPINFTAFADPTPTVVNDGYVAVRGVVTRDGVAIAGVPVALERTGGGELAPGVHSDEDGAYLALYHAPTTGAGTAMITASVLLDGALYQQQLQINFGPACTACPLTINPFTNRDQMFRIARGGSQLFSANKPVTWSVMGDGTITSAGLFTAGQTGGTVLLTATSVADPNETAIARVVVACTMPEIVGTFDGAFDTPIATALPPYTCSTGGHMTIFDIGAPQGDVTVYLACAPPISIWGDIPYAQLDSCTIGSESQTSCPQFGLIGPDPDQPGIRHRLVHVIERELVNGTCTTKFDGTGVLSH